MGQMNKRNIFKARIFQQTLHGPLNEEYDHNIFYDVQLMWQYENYSIYKNMHITMFDALYDNLSFTYNGIYKNYFLILILLCDDSNCAGISLLFCQRNMNSIICISEYFDRTLIQRILCDHSPWRPKHFSQAIQVLLSALERVNIIQKYLREVRAQKTENMYVYKIS